MTRKYFFQYFFSCFILFIFCGSIALVGTSCTTQTERLPYRPYAVSKQDESVWQEIRREFGWQASQPSEEPFYKRTARSIHKTVSGWFSEEEGPSGKGHDWDEARLQYEIRRQQAIQRVRQTNAIERRIELQQ